MEESIEDYDDGSLFDINNPSEVKASSSLKPKLSNSESTDDKQIDIFVEIKKANFLPLMYLCKVNPSTKLDVHDDQGFTPMHYAVCYGNLQVHFR